nr:4_t:CDS:2 [Entrophospora candida]
MSLLLSDFISAYTKLTDIGYNLFANYTDAQNVKVMDYLRPILIPRSSGTANNKKVREYIIAHYQNLGWHVEEDKFNDITPIGEIQFNNIIATNNINATKRLVMAAHYDTKYYVTPNDEYVGATDSALSCALLMDLADRIDPYLKKNDTANSTTLQMIFFDGEESFKTWTPADSLYGSKHLAAKWETETLKNAQPFKSNSLLDGIETFILLDLLGAKNPTLVNFFQTTSWMFRAMADIEETLHDLKILKKPAHTHTVNNDDDDNFEESSMFDTTSLTTYQAHIQDDHVPFLQRGVPVLHLIAYPFPEVWHTIDDNFTAIDPNTVYNLNSVFRIFLAEYFEIDPSKYTDIAGKP